MNKPVIYKLIDGAFFEGVCKDLAKKNGYNSFPGFNWNSIKAGAHRVVYYDALPVKKDKQTSEEFKQIQALKIQWLDNIRRLDDFQVRDGLTRLKTEKRNNTMSQVMEQKGVDTWIAVDAIQLAMRGIADEIHIYASDSDFYPVFETLQQTNCKGILYYDERRTREELIFSADSAKSITVEMVASWLLPPRPEHLNRIENDQPVCELLEVRRIETRQGDVVIAFDASTDRWHVYRELGSEKQNYIHTAYIMQAIDRARDLNSGMGYSDISSLKKFVKNNS